MRLSKYIERQDSEGRSAKRRKSKRSKPSVTSHAAFVPMVTIWGAALLGLSMLVLPEATIDRFGAIAGVGSLGGMMRYLLVVVSAVLGGALAFIGSRSLSAGGQERSDASIVSTFAERRVEPIDPASDLGSDSLDAPIDSDDVEAEFEEVASDEPEADWELEVPFDTDKPAPTLGELSKRGYEFEAPEDTEEPVSKSKDKAKESEPAFTHKQFRSALIESCEGATCEAAAAEEPALANTDTPTETAPVATLPRSDEKPDKKASAGGEASWSLTQFAPDAQKQAPKVEPKLDKPRELDLAEFAQLPGRNAVWVEEDVSVEAELETPAEPEPTPAPVPANALERLRQTPTAELSLVEMVERFAGALHEHQEQERAQAKTVGRDAALAEALKALTLFTESGFDRAAPSAGSTNLNETEQELREALAKLQTLRGAA